jgi:hypothetical protein
MQAGGGQIKEFRTVVPIITSDLLLILPASFAMANRINALGADKQNYAKQAEAWAVFCALIANALPQYPPD